MVRLGINGRVLDGVALVIFDKDGTLVELYNYWSRMIALRVELARRILGFDEDLADRLTYAMGVDTRRRRLREEGPVGLKKREVVMQAMMDALEAGGFPGTRGLCEEVFGEVDRLSEGRLADLLKPIDGMYELLASLQRGGCKAAVATTDKTGRAELAIDHLGIAGLMDAVAGADAVTRPKPSPEMVELILDRTSVDRRHAVMVGDSVTDVEMGLNAGLLASIGVLSGLADEDELLWRTPYVVRDISEIRVVEGKGAKRAASDISGVGGEDAERGAR